MTEIKYICTYITGHVEMDTTSKPGFTIFRTFDGEGNLVKTTEDHAICLLVGDVCVYCGRKA